MLSSTVLKFRKFIIRLHIILYVGGFHMELFNSSPGCNLPYEHKNYLYSSVLSFAIHRVLRKERGVTRDYSTFPGYNIVSSAVGCLKN